MNNYITKYTIDVYIIDYEAMIADFEEHLEELLVAARVNQFLYGTSVRDPDPDEELLEQQAETFTTYSPEEELLEDDEDDTGHTETFEYWVMHRAGLDYDNQLGSWVLHGIPRSGAYLSNLYERETAR